MKKRMWFLALFLFIVFAFPLIAAAQEHDDDGDDTNEPPTELEIGPEVEVPISHGFTGYGGSISLQLQPIPNWLEFEIGGGAIASPGGTEIEAEFLFEKPFQISNTTEFMIEAGPSLSKSTEADEGNGMIFNIQAEAGFFIWPNKDLGWFASAGWSDAPKNGSQSVSADAGILIPVGL